MDMAKIKELRAKAVSLPHQPGVYYMKNAEGKIIYVGKAKILPNRVSSYFTAVDRHLPKVYRMVSNVDSFDYIITATEREALILECAEIKKYKPKYNILLKDDKAYPYIKVTDEEYPKIEITRKRIEDKAGYFGPFTGNISLAADTARKVFGIPSCTRRFPRDIGKDRPCIDLDMGNCCGVCSGRVSHDEYMKRIAEAETFFKGNDKSVIKSLEAEMTAAAEKLEYEKAARIRDKIRSVRKLSENQLVVGSPTDERDVFGFACGAVKTVISIIAVRGGRITAKFIYPLLTEDFENREAGLENFVTQYYSRAAVIPPEVILPFECADSALTEEFLSEKRRRKVKVTVPKRGALTRLAEIADRNAQDALTHLETYEEKSKKAVALLGEALALEKPPDRIEMIDISHTAGSENVGAIITFIGGRKSKADYKKFKIKSFEGADDCASIREVLTRRFSDWKNKKEGFEVLPDILFVDGGEAQLNAAKQALGDCGITLPVFGLVKDDFHKTRAILSDSGLVELKMTSPAFTLAAEMQEEVHRYVIGYHRERRSKTLTRSKLDLVPGLGNARKTALIKAFGSAANVEKATPEDIAGVKGFSLKMAEDILECLQNML